MKNSRGFTLIELLVAMAIFALISAALSSVLISTSHSFSDRRAEAGTQLERRTATVALTRTLRQAGLNPFGVAGFGIQDAASDRVTVSADNNLNGIFEVSKGEQVTFYYDSGKHQLLRFAGNTISGSSGVVATGISNLSFAYLDASGNQISPLPGTDATKLGQVRTIVVNLTTQGTHIDGSGFTRTTSLTIACPNLYPN